MSDDYFREGRTASLAFWGLGQMMKGAGLAAAFVVTVGLVLWALYAVGVLLPEESKQAPDPNTWSSLAPLQDERTV
ncbi:MAG: RC-LH1 core complex protein PufX [Paracoccaceae bacterium]|nr:RC-LH1 core complex protein PufX [Paracoccaceae bacterium]